MAEAAPFDPSTEGLESYLVGGAVRDRLLDLPVKEHDFVVLGSTPQEMERRGFRMVGKDFPVFLHPKTKEEYALARTERKVAPGYRGFAVHADPGVTLRQDLERRDLTINALAQDPEGGVIDYFGGLEDLHSRTLRHVSPAFREDPLRLLRVARFAARLYGLGFRVHPQTLDLMREISASGELEALVAERVWKELVRALSTRAPSRFFVTLRDAHALGHLFPELDRLWEVPQSVDSHPEVGTGTHTMMVVDQAARLSEAPEVRFAALTHDLGKGETPRDVWPRHEGHEARSEKLAASMCRRLRAPRRFSGLAVLSARYHGRALRAPTEGPEAVLGLLEHLDAMRRPERYAQFLLVCEADFRGRKGYEEMAHPGVGYLRRAAEAVAEADRAGLPPGLTDLGAIQRFVRDRRLRSLEALARSVD